MDAKELNEVIARAVVAQATWRSLTAGERAARLQAWQSKMIEHTDALAEVVTLEQGKPINEARGEAVYAAGFIEWFAQEARRAYGDTIPSHRSDIRLSTIKQPIGVVAAITPWNFPLAMIARKAGAALAAGCACIVKPAEQTPLSAVALQRLALEVGIPGDILPIATGDAVELGSVLTNDDRVRKISFTGSTEVGGLIYAQSAPTLKKLSLELGGNAPFIVFSDADIDRALDAAMFAKFRNAGQTCVCANRFFVQAEIYDEFSKKLARRVEQLVVGDGIREEVQIGPLIDQAAFSNVASKVNEAVAEGAQILTGGGPHACGGLFFQPTVVVDAPASSRLAREEIFGPVAALVKFSEEEEVVDMANASEFGLASYILTENIRRAVRVSEALECGMVGINTGAISTEVAPFGGIKHSGLGREGGWQGLDEYLEVKMIATGI